MNKIDMKTEINTSNNDRVKLIKMKSRDGMWYIRQWKDGKVKDTSLGTRNESKAKEEAMSLHSVLKLDNSHAAMMAKIYQEKAGADYLERTWDYCFDDFADPTTKSKGSILKYESTWHNPVFDSIRDKTIADTDPTDITRILKTATASGHSLMLMLHKHAIGNHWLFVGLITKNTKDSTARKLGGSTATLEEDEYHKLLAAIDDVVACPKNQSIPKALEFKDWLVALWHIGGSSEDMANLTTDNVDWESGTLVYYREKHRGTQTGMGEKEREPVKFPMHEGGQLQTLILKRMNIAGADNHKQLFPLMSKMKSSNRLGMLMRYLTKAGISKMKKENDGRERSIKIHSFRFAIAKRMAECGISLRDAQYYLGHTCPAVARYHAGRASANLQPLEMLEAQHKATEEAQAKVA